MVVKSWASLTKSGCDDINNSNTDIILVICVFTDEELELYQFLTLKYLFFKLIFSFDLIILLQHDFFGNEYENLLLMILSLARDSK